MPFTKVPAIVSVFVVILISIYLQNVDATCTTGTSGATICAGMSQTINTTKANPASIAYGMNPDVVITSGCALNDIRYGDYFSTCYQPNILYVKPGTIVIWKNDDTWKHTVTYGNPWSEVSQGYFFDSRTMDPGESFSYQFRFQGVYPYFDAYNWWETGLIIVKK